MNEKWSDKDIKNENED